MNQIAKLSRRQFVAASLTAAGGLAISVNAATAAVIGAVPYGEPTAPNEINAFLSIEPDGTILIRSPHSEMGQGAVTSLPMIVAEELECDWAKVKVEYASPTRNLRENMVYGDMVTAGSRGVRMSWKMLQQAGASARVRLIAAAAKRWGVPEAECAAANSKVTHTASGRSLDYAALVADAAKVTLAAEPAIRTPDKFKLIGKPLARLDTPLKINGSAKFALDTRLPGMVYAAIAACPVQGGTLKSVDDAPARGRRGVLQVVKLADAVAVVADRYWRAKEALALLKPEWETGAAGKTDSAQFAKLYRDTLDGPMTSARKDGDVDAAFAGIARARDLIDLTTHQGEHPRIGATDVVPFVPLQSWGSTMEDCVALARDLGARVGDGLARQHGVAHAVRADGESAPRQAAHVAPAHRRDALVAAVDGDAVRATGAVDALLDGGERQPLEHARVERGRHPAERAHQRRQPIEPERLGAADEAGGHVERRRHAHAQELGRRLGGVRALAVVEGEEAKRPRRATRQARRQLVVVDEIEAPRQPRYVRARLFGREPVLIDDDAAKRPRAEPHRHAERSAGDGAHEALFDHRRMSPSQCVRRNGSAAAIRQAAHERGANRRASGGASVTARKRMRQSGNSVASWRREMPAKLGLLGLSTRASYQTMTPPGARTRSISRATFRRTSASRIDENTVDCSTRSKRPSVKGRRAPSPRSSVTAAGKCARAAATRTGNRSTPLMRAGSAPHRMRLRSHAPEPQPTSRISRFDSGTASCRPSSSRSTRSRSCSMNSVPGSISE